MKYVCDVCGWVYDEEETGVKFEDLPEAARNYVRYLENAVGCRIGWVSVGAGREEYIRL